MHAKVTARHTTFSYGNDISRGIGHGSNIMVGTRLPPVDLLGDVFIDEMNVSADGVTIFQTHIEMFDLESIWSAIMLLSLGWLKSWASSELVHRDRQLFHYLHRYVTRTAASFIPLLRSLIFCASEQRNRAIKRLRFVRCVIQLREVCRCKVQAFASPFHRTEL